MTEDSPYRLQSVSVVITAEFHNPSILNPDFLVSKGIVPPEWKVAEAITTPPVAIVRYDRGIQWIVEQSKLIVTEERGSSFGDHYEVHGLVRKYLENLPHVSYRSLGLNWAASFRRDDPEGWLTQRFLKPGKWLQGKPELVGMAVNFAMDAVDAECRVAFSAGNVSPDASEEQDAIIGEVNMHHAGPLNVDGLQAAIDRWPERQRFVISALDKLLRRPQT